MGGNRSATDKTVLPNADTATDEKNMTHWRDIADSTDDKNKE